MDKIAKTRYMKYLDSADNELDRNRRLKNLMGEKYNESAGAEARKALNGGDNKAFKKTLKIKGGLNSHYSKPRLDARLRKYKKDKLENTLNNANERLNNTNKYEPNKYEPNKYEPKGYEYAKYEPKKYEYAKYEPNRVHINKTEPSYTHIDRTEPSFTKSVGETANASRKLNKTKLGLGIGVGVGVAALGYGAYKHHKNHQEKVAEIVDYLMEKEAKKYEWDNAPNDPTMGFTFDYANELAHPDMNEKEQTNQMKRFYHGQVAALEHPKMHDAIKEQETKHYANKHSVLKNSLKGGAIGAVGLPVGATFGTLALLDSIPNGKLGKVLALSGAGLGAAVGARKAIKGRHDYNKVKGSTDSMKHDVLSKLKSIGDDNLSEVDNELMFRSMLPPSKHASLEDIYEEKLANYEFHGYVYAKEKEKLKNKNKPKTHKEKVATAIGYLMEK